MIRIGIDFGGTKIEAAALDADGNILARLRKPNPGDYDAALNLIRSLVAEIESQTGAATVGVGIPGSVSPVSGRVRNANSTWLNGHTFREDLQQTLDRPIRLANDANCMALSEAADGAAVGARVVFAAILGTGCGGGVVVDGRLIDGHNGVGGEWGHTPLPWRADGETAPKPCWCGRTDCLETYISGSAFTADHERATGQRLTGAEIDALAQAGDPQAVQSFDRYVSRLARALAVVVDLIDPDAIVLAGGMSNTRALYARLPDAIRPHVFSDLFTTPVLHAKHGDSSGVRGAAWLWPLDEP